jgi:C4-dicarboxylate transporter, DctM subunit
MSAERASGAGAFRALYLRVIMGAAASVMLAIVVIMLANVFYRYVLSDAIIWAEDVCRVLLVWLTFLFAGAAFARGEMVAVEILTARLSPRARALCLVPAYALCVAFLAAVTWYGWRFASVSSTQTVPALDHLWTAIARAREHLGVLGVRGGARRLRAVRDARGRSARRRVARSRGRGSGAPVAGRLMGAFVGAFAGLLLIGVPIALALGIACVLLLWWTSNLDLLLAFPQRMIAGVDQFVLLTIPLFVLAGNLMNAGGITDRIVHFSRALVGHVPGGLSQVNVVSSMFFAGVSGSATAEASALGSVLIPAMVKEGYPARYAAALTAVASVMGPIIPPSITMIIYGVLSGTSIAKLFLAGVVPGLMIGLALMGYAYWMAKRHRFAIAPKMPWAERWRAAGGALPAVLLPLIILGGILGGLFTPTESAAVAVLYAVLLAGFFYRTLTLATFWRALGDTALVTAGIMFIVAMASMVAFVFSFEQVPQKIAAGMLAISDNKIVLLLLLNLVLLLLGLFLEPLSILILTMPILLQIAKLLGVDLVQFGMICVLNVVIGMVTPPVGFCLFIVSAISGVKLEQVSLAALPMIGLCVAILLIVTFVPAVSLTLPRWFG